MSSSKIKSLKRTALLKVITKRIGAINKASEEPVKDLLSYTPNRLANELHPKAQFLKVAEIKEFSKDMKSIKLVADGEKTKKLAWFSAGQYLAICAIIDGKIYKRPYSIASSPQDTLDGFYMLTIKRVDGGIVSQHILDNLKVGDQVIASAPLGDFTYERLRDASTVIGIAGGSGITPFLSLAQAIADGDEDCNLTLLYGSRTQNDILFKDVFDSLMQKTDKFKVIHVLSAEEADGFEHGFINAELIKKYAPKGEYSIFLCGPQAMYNFADKEIATLGLRPKFIRHEVFGEYRDPFKNADYPKDAKDNKFKITVKIGDDVKTVVADANDTILNTLEHQGIAAPAECRSGICGWCRSKLVSGNVYIPKSVDGRRMADKDLGYIHICSTFPLSDLEIEVPTVK